MRPKSSQPRCAHEHHNHTHIAVAPHDSHTPLFLWGAPHGGAPGTRHGPCHTSWEAASRSSHPLPGPQQKVKTTRHETRTPPSPYTMRRSRPSRCATAVAVVVPALFRAKTAEVALHLRRGSVILLLGADRTPRLYLLPPMLLRHVYAPAHMVPATPHGSHCSQGARHLCHVYT